jgi:putative transposase
MGRVRNSEQRRKEMLLKVPDAFKDMKDWPTVALAMVPTDEQPRYKQLCKAARLFLELQPIGTIAEAAKLKGHRVLDFIETALQPWTEGTAITGTRAFVRHLVQSKRVRRKEYTPPEDGKVRPMGGFSGLFGQLLRDHPDLEIKLIEFLNGRARPNQVKPKSLWTKFQLLLGEEELKSDEYPMMCMSKARAPLLRWYNTKYVPEYLIEHLRRNNGDAVAVAARYALGDGQTRTPACDYLCWVIDECDTNVDSKVEIPTERWGAEVVRMRRFPMLRLRSTGNYSMNIAYHLCFTRQASGDDIIKLFRNAVLGQPIPPMVDPNLRPVEGAGFPQNIFTALAFVVPVIVYLDNALAHLYNDLNELVMRLFGCRVVLGTPGTPKGRPEIESNIHVTRKCFNLQLPGSHGWGHQDPVRQIAEAPTEKLIHANYLEQAVYCVLANENVSDTAGAGYLDAFTRMRDLLARGGFEAAKLPEHKRAPWNFSAPKRKKVLSNLAKSRLPHIWLGNRYSSQWLKLNRFESGKEFWVMQDLDDLRTAILLDDNLAYVDTLQCQGEWGLVPHDSRIMRIYNSRKYAARFKVQPRDLPLHTVLESLAEGAKHDWSMAQDYAYVVSYLKRKYTAEELAAVQLELGSLETPLVFDDGYVPPPAVAAAAPAPTPAPAARFESDRVAAPAPAPRALRSRFSVPRGMR